MDDNDEEIPPEMTELLNGLSTLTEKSSEPWLCEAYRSALESLAKSMGVRRFIDCLHRRWLTDVRIVWPAVQLCNTISSQRSGLSTLIHAVMLNDFRNRHELRKISRSVFANSARFMIDYFRSNYRGPFFDGSNKPRSVHPTASQSSTTTSSEFSTTLHGTKSRYPIVYGYEDGEEQEVNPFYEELFDPIFEYLSLLVDESAARPEILLFHETIMTLGQAFQRFDFQRMHQLGLQVRRCLIQNISQSLDRALLMEALEMLLLKCRSKEMSDDVCSLYSKYKAEHDVFTGSKAFNQ